MSMVTSLRSLLRKTQTVSFLGKCICTSGANTEMCSQRGKVIIKHVLQSIFR